jgi:hypothetical protein
MIRDESESRFFSVLAEVVDIGFGVFLAHAAIALFI